MLNNPPQNRGSSSSVSTRIDPQAVRAADEATRKAHARPTGFCAKYVRKALQKGGYTLTPNPSAYQYHTRGTMTKMGFKHIAKPSTPLKGDVIVYGKTAAHIHGHMQIYNGNQWVSDFRQKGIVPWSGPQGRMYYYRDNK